MSARGIRYGRGPARRALDLALSIPALVVLAPLMALLAAAILVAMGRPVLFRHERVGMDGRRFLLAKFRSMRNVPGLGLPITGGGDTRITPLGRFLRRTKLDELPQLFNIVAGEMSIVGPRPEVPRYVALYDDAQRAVLAVRPGLTDPAALAYRNEEALLGAVPAERREAFYVAEVMPRKLALSLAYLHGAGLAGDIGVILRTIGAVVGGARP